jgi:hypothetical protein
MEAQYCYRNSVIYILQRTGNNLLLLIWNSELGRTEMGSDDKVSGLSGCEIPETTLCSVCDDFFEHVVRSPDTDEDLQANIYRLMFLDIQHLLIAAKNHCLSCGLISDMFEVVGKPLSNLVEGTMADRRYSWKLEARHYESEYSTPLKLYLLQSAPEINEYSLVEVVIEFSMIPMPTSMRESALLLHPNIHADALFR